MVKRSETSNTGRFTRQGVRSNISRSRQIQQQTDQQRPQEVNQFYNDKVFSEAEKQQQKQAENQIHEAHWRGEIDRNRLGLELNKLRDKAPSINEYNAYINNFYKSKKQSDMVVRILARKGGIPAWHVTAYKKVQSDPNYRAFISGRIARDKAQASRSRQILSEKKARQEKSSETQVKELLVKSGQSDQAKDSRIVKAILKSPSALSQLKKKASGYYTSKEVKDLASSRKTQVKAGLRPKVIGGINRKEQGILVKAGFSISKITSLPKNEQFLAVKGARSILNMRSENKQKKALKELKEMNLDESQIPIFNAVITDLIKSQEGSEKRTDSINRRKAMAEATKTITRATATLRGFSEISPSMEKKLRAEEFKGSVITPVGFLYLINTKNNEKKKRRLDELYRTQLVSREKNGKRYIIKVGENNQIIEYVYDLEKGKLTKRTGINKTISTQFGLTKSAFNKLNKDVFNFQKKLNAIFTKQKTIAGKINTILKGYGEPTAFVLNETKKSLIRYGKTIGSGIKFIAEQPFLKGKTIEKDYATILAIATKKDRTKKDYLILKQATENLDKNQRGLQTRYSEESKARAKALFSNKDVQAVIFIGSFILAGVGIGLVGGVLGKLGALALKGVGVGIIGKQAIDTINNPTPQNIGNLGAITSLVVLGGVIGVLRGKIKKGKLNKSEKLLKTKLGKLEKKLLNASPKQRIGVIKQINRVQNALANLMTIKKGLGIKKLTKNQIKNELAKAKKLMNRGKIREYELKTGKSKIKRLKTEAKFIKEDVVKIGKDIKTNLVKIKDLPKTVEGKFRNRLLQGRLKLVKLQSRVKKLPKNITIKLVDTIKTLKKQVGLLQLKIKKLSKDIKIEFKLAKYRFKKGITKKQLKIKVKYEKTINELKLTPKKIKRLTQKRLNKLSVKLKSSYKGLVKSLLPKNIKRNFVKTFRSIDKSYQRIATRLKFKYQGLSEKISKKVSKISSRRVRIQKIDLNKELAQKIKIKNRVKQFKKVLGNINKGIKKLPTKSRNAIIRKVDIVKKSVKAILFSIKRITNSKLKKQIKLNKLEIQRIKLSDQIEKLNELSGKNIKISKKKLRFKEIKSKVGTKDKQSVDTLIKNYKEYNTALNKLSIKLQTDPLLKLKSKDLAKLKSLKLKKRNLLNQIKAKKRAIIKKYGKRSGAERDLFRDIVLEEKKRVLLESRFEQLRKLKNLRKSQTIIRRQQKALNKVRPQEVTINGKKKYPFFDKKVKKVIYFNTVKAWRKAIKQVSGKTREVTPLVVGLRAKQGALRQKLRVLRNKQTKLIRSKKDLTKSRPQAITINGKKKYAFYDGSSKARYFDSVKQWRKAIIGKAKRVRPKTQTELIKEAKVTRSQNKAITKFKVTQERLIKKMNKQTLEDFAKSKYSYGGRTFKTKTEMLRAIRRTNKNIEPRTAYGLLRTLKEQAKNRLITKFRVFKKRGKRLVRIAKKKVSTRKVIKGKKLKTRRLRQLVIKKKPVKRIRPVLTKKLKSWKFKDKEIKKGDVITANKDGTVTIVETVKKKIVNNKPISELTKTTKVKPIEIKNIKKAGKITRITAKSSNNQIFTFFLPTNKVRSINNMVNFNAVKQIKLAFTLPVLKLKQLGLPSKMSKSIILSATESKRDYEIISKIRSASISDNKLKSIILSRIKPATAIKPLVALKPRSRTILKLKQKPPIKPKLFLLGYVNIKPNMKSLQRAGKIDVYVKKGGAKTRYVRANKGYLTPSDAIKFARYVVDNSRLASYVFRRSKLSKRQTFKANTPSIKFRPTKGSKGVSKNAIVEKRKYRIDSVGEKRQISTRSIRRLSSAKSIKRLLTKRKKKKVTKKKKKTTKKKSKSKR